MLDRSACLRSLEENVGQFAEAAELGLEPRVPGCPEWTLGQLVVHLGDVYDFWSRVVEARIPDLAGVRMLEQQLEQERGQRSRPDFYQAPEALAYLERNAMRIIRVLAAADPAQPNWTWWPGSHSAGFVQRRMAHETSVHRWDAQSAHGVQQPIAPPDVAADGIDELLKNELTGWPDEGRTFPKASFHLHCTDTPGEWLIRATGEAVQLIDQHAKADVAATGAASDLLLWLWGRIPPAALRIHGDPELLPQLRGMIEE